MKGYAENEFHIDRRMPLELTYKKLNYLLSTNFIVEPQLPLKTLWGKSKQAGNVLLTD